MYPYKQVSHRVIGRKIGLIILRDDYVEGYEAMVANQMPGFIDIITTFSHLDMSFLVFCYSYYVCWSATTIVTLILPLRTQEVWSFCQECCL